MADLYKCQGTVKSGHPCCNKMKYRNNGNDKRFCWKHLDQESAIAIPYTNSVYLDDNDCMDDESFLNFLEYLSSLSVETPPSPPPPPSPSPHSVPRPSVEDCSICMEQMSRSTFVFTVCAHKFHPTCLNKWVEAGHVTCPLCRLNIL